jgi:hypothetical protein
VLAGSIKPGDQAAGKGVSLIAAQGDVEVQAQSDVMELAAKGLVNIMSANAHIDWAAAKRIVMSTAGGANITMEGGNITVQCPGTITVKAGAKSFTGPSSTSYVMPKMPAVPLPNVPFKFNLFLTDVPGPQGVPLTQTDWKIVKADSQEAALVSTMTVTNGRSDDKGALDLGDTQQRKLRKMWNRAPGQLWIVSEGHAHQLWLSQDNGDWTESQAQKYALDAMGYSDDMYVANGRPVEDYFAQLARDHTKLNSGIALLKSLKGGA